MKPRNPNSSTSTTPSAADVAHGDKDRAATETAGHSLNEDVDTLRLVALQHNDKLELVENGTDNVAPYFDPYNSKGLVPAENKPRRSIDDLRKLSAEITKAKSYTRKDK